LERLGSEMAGLDPKLDDPFLQAELERSRAEEDSVDFHEAERQVVEIETSAWQEGFGSK
jgi:hypothetical protein